MQPLTRGGLTDPQWVTSHRTPTRNSSSTIALRYICAADFGFGSATGGLFAVCDGHGGGSVSEALPPLLRQKLTALLAGKTDLVESVEALWEKMAVSGKTFSLQKRFQQLVLFFFSQFCFNFCWNLLNHHFFLKLKNLNNLLFLAPVLLQLVTVTEAAFVEADEELRGTLEEAAERCGSTCVAGPNELRFGGPLEQPFKGWTMTRK